jgi:hypothetical protein
LIAPAEDRDTCQSWLRSIFRSVTWPQLGSWLLQALPGSRWKVPDGIEDGIPEEIGFGCPVFAMFERRCALILRCGLPRADNCRLDFSVWLTVSSLPSGRRSRIHKGPRPRLTIEWGYPTPVRYAPKHQAESVAISLAGRMGRIMGRGRPVTVGVAPGGVFRAAVGVCCLPPHRLSGPFRLLPLMSCGSLMLKQFMGNDVLATTVDVPHHFLTKHG